MVHKAKRWEKMFDESDFLVYGKPNAPDVLIAEKWERGWAIDKAKDVTPKEFKGEWKFKDRKVITNVGTKKEAKKAILDLIKEGY